MFGLCVQLLNHQYYRHEILAHLVPYKKVEQEDFLQEKFPMIWNKVIKAFQCTLWHINPWQYGMKLEMYMDALSAGCGAILFGDSRILVMFSCTSAKAY